MTNIDLERARSQARDRTVFRSSAESLFLLDASSQRMGIIPAMSQRQRTRSRKLAKIFLPMEWFLFPKTSNKQLAIASSLLRSFIYIIVVGVIFEFLLLPTEDNIWNVLGLEWSSKNGEGGYFHKVVVIISLMIILFPSIYLNALVQMDNLSLLKRAKRCNYAFEKAVVLAFIPELRYFRNYLISISILYTLSLLMYTADYRFHGEIFYTGIACIVLSISFTSFTIFIHMVTCMIPAFRNIEM